MAKGKFSVPRSSASTAPVPEAQAVPGASNRKKLVLISVIAAAVVLMIGLILGVWYFAGSLTDDHLILNNVTIAGVNLGGMTKEEAITAVHRATDLTYTSENMVIHLPDTTLELSPADTGANLDVEAAVDEAYNYGRTGTKAEREQAKANALVSEHPIALLNYLNLDLDFIRRQLDDYASRFNSTFIPSSVTVEGEKPELNAAKESFDADAPGQTLVLVLGQPGRYLDIDALYNEVLDHYSFNRFEITAQMQEAEKIPDELDLEELYKQYASDPIDAQMDLETYEVTPEVYGYGFDLEQALEQFKNATYGDTLEIQLSMIAPDMLGEELSSMLFRDVLASYETAHTNDSNRNTNLTLACAAINNVVLQPGDTFDYNKTLGQRTAEKGYKSAGAYSGGQSVSEIGGGICQVSSTLYYCTLIADLEIISRSPHSYVSSYMPMGMDASVSWGGPEFRFQNNTHYPIRIEAEVSGGQVRVKLIGTDEKYYYIKMEYEVTSTVYPETKTVEIPENDNPKGYTDGQVITTPYTGYTVNTYKCKYDKETNKLISRDFDKTSKYKYRNKEIASIIPVNKPTEPTPTTPEPTTPAPTTPPATEAPAATEPPAAPDGGISE